jgi:hypothetical protein
METGKPSMRAVLLTAVLLASGATAAGGTRATPAGG